MYNEKNIKKGSNNFMVTNRVQELDSSENLRNTNTSLSINFTR